MIINSRNRMKLLIKIVLTLVIGLAVIVTPLPVVFPARDDYGNIIIV